MSVKNILTQFHTINTEEKAYWLGFLYADGYISYSENKIELSLAEQDKHQIEKFKAFMRLPNQIVYRESVKAYRFSFRSNQCKQDLIKQGCIPRKSLILIFPTEKQVPSNLLRHFIRGYFDGDGWFTNTENCFQVGIIGTENFIKGFLDAIENLVNTKNTLFSVHRENGAKRYVINAYQEVSNFLNYIYRDSSVFLDRKYDNYINFLINGSRYHKSMK